VTRERSYTWGDPHVLAEAATGLPGIDFLQRVSSGELPLPPAGATTGIAPVGVGDGWARFELEPAEWHYNPLGTVHGGILATLADTALGCAVHTKLPAGTSYTSMDLTIKFTRPATLGSGMLTCEGTVVALGRRSATAEARITDMADRVIAHAVTTCLLFGDAAIVRTPPSPSR
jgi:uncharacterized protein (TIGR00369 family)